MSEKKGVLNRFLSWGLGENASAAVPSTTPKPTNASSTPSLPKQSSHGLSRPAKPKLGLGSEYVKTGIILAGVAGAYFAIAFIFATLTVPLADALPSILFDGLIAVGGSAVVLIVGRGKSSKPKVPAALSGVSVQSEPTSEDSSESKLEVNTASLVLCKKCSAPLPEGVEKCEKCGTPVKGKPFDEYGVCPQGGAHRIYPGALICAKCGKPLGEISGKPEPDKTPPVEGQITGIASEKAEPALAGQKSEPAKHLGSSVEEQLYRRLTGRTLGEGDEAA